MNHLRATIALCLLGLLAALLAEETVQKQQVDAGLEREVREAEGTGQTEEDDDDTELEGNTRVARDIYKDVLSRQKRHSKDKYCGMCHAKKGVSMEWPCVKYKKECAKWKTCGWWFRKHKCCKKWKWVVVKKWCCSNVDTYYPLRPKYPMLRPVCLRTKYASCGGFSKTGARYLACRLRYKPLGIYQYFCNFNYKLIGNYCYKKYSFCGGFSKFGKIYPTCYYKPIRYCSYRYVIVKLTGVGYACRRLY